MLARFVCLANSFKEGGKCLAGVELDENNNPVIKNGRPKWIRPICNTEHGEVPSHLCRHLKILDIVEIEVTSIPNVVNYQSENILFNEDSIKVVGNYERNRLNILCDNRNLIFGNKGKAVSKDVIGDLTYSLMLIKVNSFEINERSYENTPDKTQIRMIFNYKEKKYDLPITDPVFLNKYENDPNSIPTDHETFLSLSLAVEWSDWFYKLVAGVIVL